MPVQARGMETNPPQRPSPPALAAMVRETVPLIVCIAGFGPPVLLMAAPWVLLALLVAGPFALVVLIVVALAAAAVVVAGVAALLATPYLLLRRRRSVERATGPVRVRVGVPA
jgi:hypothetical protein